MPVGTAISNFQSWRERQQARQEHEQLNTEETHESHPLEIPEGDDTETGAASPASAGSTTPMVETVPEDEDEDGEDMENQASSGRRSSAVIPPSDGVRGSRPGRITLADLEEERELARRRTSFCVLFSVFILFRLWIQAVATGDFLLLMICLMGTSWTARFLRATREREEELDRMISEYNENTDGDNGMSRTELQRLSFQAQLAMAIINSQRDMMNGGYGHPDGGGNTPGVSDEAKEQWDRFEFQPDGKGYGSLSGIVDLEKASKSVHAKEEDEPHCSICLGEYEAGEKLICLPCKHVYHDDCISSWCDNHIRCPLCNLDLESVSDSATSAGSSV